ncbi:unnamed protein product [Effrenium voratum]|uniref:Uncharacterized protein n=1 Tax=Effrenium voratum TaxID=2562239 RepID=A0AA36ILW9_9DINO|nr:unnamed protein product [Effrenium voratum]
MFAMDGRSSGESAAQLAALRGDIAALVREVGQLQGVAKSGAQVSAEESHAVLNQVAALRGQMSTVLDALAPTLQEKASKSDPELANAVSGLSTLCEATMRYCQEAAGGQAALTSQLAELQEETGVMAAALRRLRSVLQGDVENAFKQIINEAAARQDRRCETPRRSLQDFHGLRWREVRHDSREIGREASNALRTQATWERERPRPPPQEVAMLRRMLREHRQAQLAQPSPGSAPSSLPRRQELPERMERPRHALPDSSLSLHRGLMTAPALLQRPQRTRFGSLQHGDMAAQAPASPSPQALFPDVQPSPQSTRFGNLQHGDMAAQALASPSPQALLPDVQPSPQPTKLGNLQPSDMAAQALASPNPQALLPDVQPSPQSTRFGNLQHGDMAAPNPQALFHDVQPSPQSTRFGNLQHRDMAQAMASPSPIRVESSPPLPAAQQRVRLAAPSPEPSPQLLMQHSTRSWQLVEDIGPENQGPRQQTDGIQSLLQQMLEMQRSQLQLLQSLSQNQVPAALRDVPADQEPLWPPVVATRPWWLTESPARPMRLPEAQASVPKASPLDVQQVHQQLSHLHKIEQELQRMKEMPSRDTHQVYQELMQLQRLQNQLQQVCLQEPQHTRQVLPELQFAHLDQRTITDLPALFSLETEPELVESREVASAFPAPLAGSIARAPSPPPTPQPLRSPPPPPPPAGEREGPQWGDLQLQLREQSWAQEKVVDANRGKGLVKMNELADAGHRAEFMKRQQDSLAARLIHSGLAPELSVSYDSSMSTLPPSGRHESEDTEQRIESEPTSPDQTRLTPHTTAAPSAALATSPPAAGWTHRPEQDLSETHRAEESRLRSSRESQACSLDSGSPSFDGLEGCQHSFIFSPNGHLREALPGRNSSFVPQGAPADDEMGVPPVSSSEEFRPKLVKELLSRARDALNGQAELSPPRDPRSSWPTPSPELPAEVQRQSPEPHPPPARPSPSFGWKELQSHKFRAWFAELEPVNATAALSASSTSAPEVAMPTEPVCLPHSAAAG